MKIWRCMGALVLLGAVALGVRAYGEQGAGKDVPSWTAFDDKAKPFYQVMTTETTQTMTVQGQEVKQKQKQTFLVKWTPKEVDKNKWTVEYKIEGVKMNIQIGGNTIEFDSTDKTAPDNPLTQFFKALIGSAFTFKIERNESEGMKVKKVEGLPDFVSKLAAANDQLKDLLKTILSEDALKQMSDPTFAAFPKSEKEFKEGKWDYDLKMNMGPIGTYKTKYTFKADPKDATKIAVEGSMTYEAPKGNDAAGLPFIIQEGSDLKSTKFDGTITLDKKLGRIEKSEMNMDLKGTLKIDIAGNVTPVVLDQRQVSTVETYDDFDKTGFKQAAAK